MSMPANQDCIVGKRLLVNAGGGRIGPKLFVNPFAINIVEFPESATRFHFRMKVAPLSMPK